MYSKTSHISLLVLSVCGACYGQSITNGVFTGNLKLQPNTTSTPQQPGNLIINGQVDIYGNLLNFGSAGSTANPAVVFNYTDDPTGATSNISSSTYRNALSWKWQQNSAGGQKSKMLLDNNNKLSLFDLTGTSKITLDPIAGNITVNGQALLQPNSFGNVGLGTTSPTHSLTVASTGTGISLYRTTDQTTNYERLLMGWSGTTFGINTQSSGMGVARTLSLGVNGSNAVNISSGLPKVTFTGTTATAGNVVSVGGSYTQSTGIANVFAITPTITQTGTGGYTALLVNPTETTTGSGAKNLADFQTGGASKFVVRSTGNVGIGTTNPTSSLHLSTPTPNTVITYTNNDSAYTAGAESSVVNRFVLRPTTAFMPILTISQPDDTTARGAFFEFFGRGTPDSNDSEALRFILNDALSLSGSQDAVIDTDAAGAGVKRNIQLRPGGVLTGFFGITGNVGIGTTTPTERLEVAGNVKVSGVITCAPGGDIPMF